jgi:hypothetical protein
MGTAIVLLFAVATARASDPAPGLILPSAVAMGAGHGEVSISSGRFFADLDGNSFVTARFGVAPTDRLWIEVAGVHQYRTDLALGLATAGMASVRYDVIERPELAVAPLALIIVGAEGVVVPSAGVAIEGGGVRVRGDFTVVSGWGDGVPVILEGGVSYRWGPLSEHTVRLGVAELLPDLSYRFERRNWFAELGVTGAPPLLGGVRAEIGVRF